jgi:hypothetical protein
MKSTETTSQTSLPRLTISTALVCCLAALMVVLLSLLEEVHRRFFFRPGVEKHLYAVFLAILIVAFLTVYVTTVVSSFRGEFTWGYRLLLALMSIPFCLRWIIVILIAPFMIAMLAPYYAARTPDIYQTTVLDSSNYRSHGRNVRAAKFLLPNGAAVRVSDSDIKPALFLTRPILVNGVCSLDQLRPGQSITVYARRSSFGYAIDRITSVEPCSKPAVE